MLGKECRIALVKDFLIQEEEEKNTLWKGKVFPVSLGTTLLLKKSLLPIRAEEVQVKGSQSNFLNRNKGWAITAYFRFL